MSGVLKGSTRESGKPQHVIKFFDRNGRFLRILKVPGAYFPSLTWEGNGLRLALAVDAYIFFANVRPNYIWCAGGNTIAYSFQRPDRKEMSVVFWNTNTHEPHTKYLGSLSAPGISTQDLRFLKSNGEFFFLVIAERAPMSARQKLAAAASSLAEEKSSGSKEKGAAKGSKYDDDEDV